MENIITHCRLVYFKAVRQLNYCHVKVIKCRFPLESNLVEELKEIKCECSFGSLKCSRKPSKSQELHARVRRWTLDRTAVAEIHIDVMHSVDMYNYKVRRTGSRTRARATSMTQLDT
jgi:hypothetical protein